MDPGAIVSTCPVKGPVTDIASSPVRQQHRPSSVGPDHWFGGASGGRVVVTGLVGTSAVVAWFASASILVALLAAMLVLIAAATVALSL